MRKQMEQAIAKLKESIDALLADFNGRAEEVKENFNSFKDVFGKELELQKDQLKVYRERLGQKGRKVFDAQAFANDMREEFDIVLKDLRTGADRFYGVIKQRLDSAR